MRVDLLIEAGWIIPVEPVSVIYRNYSLVIDQGRIIDVLDSQWKNGISMF